MDVKIRLQVIQNLHVTAALLRLYENKKRSATEGLPFLVTIGKSRGGKRFLSAKMGNL